MVILTHWRILNGLCKKCNKVICECSTWCRCSKEQIAEFYEELWIFHNAPEEDRPTTKTIDIILSEIQSTPKLGNMLWKELHELPLHIKHVGGIYDEDTIKEINQYLASFKVKMICTDCREHFTKLIIDNPFKGNTPRLLWEYINDAHNYVNVKLNRKKHDVSEAIINIAQNLKKQGHIRWLDIFDYNGWFNFKPLEDVSIIKKEEASP